MRNCEGQVQFPSRTQLLGHNSSLDLHLDELHSGQQAVQIPCCAVLHCDRFLLQRVSRYSGDASLCTPETVCRCSRLLLG